MGKGRAIVPVQVGHSVAVPRVFSVLGYNHDFLHQREEVMIEAEWLPPYYPGAHPLRFFDWQGLADYARTAGVVRSQEGE